MADSPYPRILALDLARVAGAAWRDADGVIVTRAFTLGKKNADKVPEHLLALETIVDELIQESGCDLVAIEKDFGRGAGSNTLRQYHTVAKIVATKAGKKVVCKLMATSCRKKALGYGGGNKPEIERRAHVLIPGSKNWSNDEIDAAILLIATEAMLREEAILKRIKAATKTRKPRVKAA